MLANEHVRIRACALEATSKSDEYQKGTSRSVPGVGFTARRTKQSLKDSIAEETSCRDSRFVYLLFIMTTLRCVILFGIVKKSLKSLMKPLLSSFRLVCLYIL